MRATMLIWGPQVESAAVNRSRTRDLDKSESDVCVYSLLWVVENLIVDTVLGDMRYDDDYNKKYNSKIPWWHFVLFSINSKIHTTTNTFILFFFWQQQIYTYSHRTWNVLHYLDVFISAIGLFLTYVIHTIDCVIQRKKLLTNYQSKVNIDK